MEPAPPSTTSQFKCLRVTWGWSPAASGAGAAETSPWGLARSHGMPVVGTRGRLMWAVCASQSLLRLQQAPVHLPSEVEEILRPGEEPEHPLPSLSSQRVRGGSELHQSLPLGPDSGCPLLGGPGVRLRLMRAVGLRALVRVHVAQRRGVRPPRSTSISESESGSLFAPSPQSPWSPFSLLPPPLHTSL